MNGRLLDTNFHSELSRPKPNQKVVDFVATQPLDLLFVSIVTFAEIRFGIEAIADPIRRAYPHFVEKLSALGARVRWE